MDDQWNQNPNGGTPADPNAGQVPAQDPGTGAPAAGGWTPPPAQPDPNAGVQTPPAPDPVPAQEPAQPAWNPTPTPPADPVQTPAQPTTGTWNQGNQVDNSGTNQGGAV